MKINLSADTYEDAGIESLVSQLCGKNLSKFFKEKNYGNNDVEIFMVINCVPHNFKLRKRYDSKDKVLYWDVLLNYETVKQADIEQKKSILANSIITSFDILDSYKKLKLDKDKLKDDAKKYFIHLKWLRPAIIRKI